MPAIEYHFIYSAGFGMDLVVVWGSAITWFVVGVEIDVIITGGSRLAVLLCAGRER